MQSSFLSFNSILATSTFIIIDDGGDDDIDILYDSIYDDIDDLTDTDDIMMVIMHDVDLDNNMNNDDHDDNK